MLDDPQHVVSSLHSVSLDVRQDPRLLQDEDQEVEGQLGEDRAERRHLRRGLASSGGLRVRNRSADSGNQR